MNATFAKLARQEGSITIWVASGFLVLMAFTALAIDAGKIYVARTQLAAAADAGALAAMQVLRSGGTVLDARAAAESVAERNRVLSGGVDLVASDIVMGDYDYTARVFTPGGISLAPAIEVTARRTAGSPSGQLPLALASVISSPAADVLARAVASSGCREIVLVQDVTVSFAEEIAQARDALREFVRVMSDHTLPGDQLGLVIFAASSRVLVPLSPMPLARAEIEAAIDQEVVDCRYGNRAEIFPGQPSAACSGTDQAKGIDAAREIFANHTSTCGAERSIVIVSDGVPCGTLVNGVRGGTEAGVIAAVDAAADQGLNITPIMLWDPDAPEQQCAHPGMGALAFNDSMARGWGQPLNTPDPDELAEMLRSVLSQIPVRLVQ